MKKKNVNQSLEKIVEANDTLGLEMNSIKGGVAQQRIKCDTGYIDDGNNIKCVTGKLVP